MRTIWNGHGVISFNERWVGCLIGPYFLLLLLNFFLECLEFIMFIEIKCGVLTVLFETLFTTLPPGFCRWDTPPIFCLCYKPPRFVCGTHRQDFVYGIHRYDSVYSTRCRKEIFKELSGRQASVSNSEDCTDNWTKYIFTKGLIKEHQPWVSWRASSTTIVSKRYEKLHICIFNW